MDEQMRKEAFRVAYDFLEKHPEKTLDPEYYTKTAKEIAEVVREHPDNILLPHLMLAVYNAMETYGRSLFV